MNIYIHTLVALVVKNPPANAGDASLIPGSGRTLGEGNGNPLQYSCLENPMAEEPSGLQSVGLQRVRYGWSELAHTYVYIYIPPHLRTVPWFCGPERVTSLILHTLLQWRNLDRKETLPSTMEAKETMDSLSFVSRACSVIQTLASRWFCLGIFGLDRFMQRCRVKQTLFLAAMGDLRVHGVVCVPTGSKCPS